MRTIDSIEPDWQNLISKLSRIIDLDTTARERGALLRRRIVQDGATLLRLALAYGPGGMSLRSAAAWAGLNDVANLSDVALLKRLCGSADWLGDIAGALLADASKAAPSTGSRSLRIVDGSSISQPGSVGTDFRLHATYEPALSRFMHLEITDAHSGEAFARVPLRAGDIIVGDRAYARAPSLEKVIAVGADFIVRSGWRTIRIVTTDGRPIDWNATFGPMQVGEVREIDVFVEHSGHKQKGRGKPLFQARLIIKRKDTEAAARSLKSAISGHQRRRASQAMLPTTVVAAGFVMVLTSIPATDMTAEAVLDVYRLRWQIELAFKRLKSGLGIHKLPAKDSRLARTWLMAHLILALMIDEAVNDVLDSPPCGDDNP